MAIKLDGNDDFWSKLETKIVSLGPKEALLSSRDAEFEAIAKLLERNSVIVTIHKRSKAKLKVDVSRLLQSLNGVHISIATNEKRQKVKICSEFEFDLI